MSKYQMQDVDCIARKNVFLPIQTGHNSYIKIDISVVARDGYSLKYKTRVQHQLTCVLSAYSDSFRYRPGNARESSALLR